LEPNNDNTAIMKLIILLFALFLFSFQALSQEKRTLSGFITDGSSGDKLFGASVFDTVSRNGAWTNDYGFFSLTIPNEDAFLRVSSYGLKTKYLFVPKGTDQLDIQLDNVLELSEVTVTAAGTRQVDNSGSGVIEIQMDKLDKLPLILGEKDVMRMIQLLPGVKSGGEASSGIYVRGGGPDQNLILLDGVPVYNTSHLFGFFSVFNSDAISKVSLIKGGFAARYGGRVSAVLDMRMKEGNMKRYKVEGSVGLISSRILVEGPIKKDKTSFMVSGRRTYLDLLIKPFMRNQSSKGGYFFNDFNAKIQHKINDKHHLYLSGYFGLDKATLTNNVDAYYDDAGNRYKSESENNLKWGNSIGAVRWNYRVSPKLFINTTGTFSDYLFFIGQSSETEVTNTFGDKNKTLFKNGFSSGIRDWSLKSDATFFLNPKHNIKFGVSDIYHTFTPGVSQTTIVDSTTNFDSNSGGRRQYSHELGVYIEDDFTLGTRVKINAGYRHSLLIVGSKTYNNPEPRLNLNMRLAERTSVKVGLSRTAQYLHLLSNIGIGLPADLWVPATKNVKPVVANQASVGFYQELTKNIVFSVEGYYKTMSNLIQYKEGADFNVNGTDWEETVTAGNGTAYGAEFLLEKKKGNFSGWIGYTLSWSIRQFDELNNGEPFAHRYDRRHDLNVALSYDITDTWDIGIIFVYATGNAVTVGSQGYGVSNFFGGGNFNTLINYTSLNGYRMPDYHRMDIGANRKKQRKFGESTLSLSIYNVYNRLNPFFIYKGVNQSNNPALIGVSLFPIIPSVSWNFKFDFDKMKEIKLNSIKD
jgi:outer membrane cobalamin receptor